MKIITNKYKKVADFVYDLFKLAEMPLHFSKFSNRIYSNYQKLFLLVYKQFRKFTYEELLTDLSDNVDLRAYLGLNKLPHFTTLIKFAKKLNYSILDKLILAFKKLIPEPKKVAIDATGISLDNASAHYCKRIGKVYRKRPFMKTTFIVDIENYLILLCKMRKGHRHDTKDAKPMIKKLALHYKPDIFYADRGYDDEEIFKDVFENLGAYPLILQKNMHLPSHKKKGQYRKMTCKVFDYGEYLCRNRIETLNSMIKKRFGSKSKSRLCKTQKIDVIMKVIAFNIDRLIRIRASIVLILLKIRRISY
jgi:hypothetical protein